jgi:hypothetical protein
VTCSELPNPELVISQFNYERKQIKVIAKAKDQIMDGNECGYTSLAQSPVDHAKFASSSQVIHDSEKGIDLWQVDAEAWRNGKADYSVQTSYGKRQRTEVARIAPVASLKCQNGVQSMHWASMSTLIAGTTDH